MPDGVGMGCREADVLGAERGNVCFIVRQRLSLNGFRDTPEPGSWGLV